VSLGKPVVLAAALIASLGFGRPLEALDWPLRPFGSQHGVTSTLGEARVDSLGNLDHFHAGVDVAAGQGDSVFAADSGVVWGSTPSSFWIDDYRYVHISASVGDDDTVPLHDFIGTVDYPAAPHLHLREKSSPVSPYDALNLLMDGGLYPYADLTDPQIASVFLYQQGSVDSLLSDTLNGRVDILCVAGDTRTDTAGQAPEDTGNVSIYRIGYEIRDSLGSVAKPYWEGIRFGTIPNPSDSGQLHQTYDTASSNTHFRYWVTNDPFDPDPGSRDRYWNTKQDSGATDSVDADSIEEALFPRGVYWVKVYAYDVDSNSCAESVQVYIDNFGPRIDSVSPDSGQTGVSIGSSIDIEFDEPMDQNVGLNSVIVFNPGVSVSWQWLNSMRLRGTPQPSLEPGTDYIVTIHDYADGDSLRDIVGHLFDGDRDGVPGGDFSWPFSTGDSDTMMGWGMPYQWEGADSGFMCDADLRVEYGYLCLLDSLLWFCGWPHSFIDVAGTGSIWFDEADTSCYFDLPSAAGQTTGVIAVHNDCLKTDFLYTEGHLWVRMAFNPTRYIVEWWFKDTSGPVKVTDFEAVLFTNGWIRFDYRKQEITKFHYDGGSGISCGNEIDYVQLPNVSNVAPASFMFGPNVSPGKPASEPEGYAAASLGLRWPTNPESDLGGYYLYRGSGASPDTFFKLHDSVVTDTYFVDLTAYPCSTYSYEVSAVDTHWFEGEQSDRLVGIVPPVPGACSTATAYNVGRKLAKDKEKMSFFAAYTYKDTVWTTRTDCEGCFWSVPRALGEGKLPSIAMSSTNDIWVVWVGGDSNDVILYSTCDDVSWTAAETLFDFEGVYRFNSLSFGMDNTGYGNVVVDRYNPGGSLLYTPFFYLTYLIRFSSTGEVDPWVTTIRTHETLDARSSIDCDATDLHVAWDEGDLISYRFGQGSGDTVVWDQPEVISQQAIPARYPCIEYGKDSVSIVWQGNVSGRYRVYHRRKSISDSAWLSVERVDSSDNVNSVYPVVSGGCWAAWVEELLPSAIFCSERSDTTWVAHEVVKSTSGDSKFPHAVMYQRLPSRYSLVCWTEPLPGWGHGIESQEKAVTTLAAKGTALAQPRIGSKNPNVFSLAQNRPNPFVGATRISFGLPLAGHVALDVFNVTGQRVRRVLCCYMKAGRYDAIWDGTDDDGRSLGSGAYFARLVAGEFIETRKMVLVR
jgi:hypothetical protein